MKLTIKAHAIHAILTMETGNQACHVTVLPGCGGIVVSDERFADSEKADMDYKDGIKATECSVTGMTKEFFITVANLLNAMPDRIWFRREFRGRDLTNAFKRDPAQFDKGIVCYEGNKYSGRVMYALDIASVWADDKELLRFNVNNVAMVVEADSGETVMEVLLAWPGTATSSDGDPLAVERKICEDIITKNTANETAARVEFMVRLPEYLAQVKVMMEESTELFKKRGVTCIGDKLLDLYKAMEGDSTLGLETCSKLLNEVPNLTGLPSGALRVLNEVLTRALAVQKNIVLCQMYSAKRLDGTMLYYAPPVPDWKRELTLAGVVLHTQGKEVATKYVLSLQNMPWSTKKVVTMDTGGLQMIEMTGPQSMDDTLVMMATDAPEVRKSGIAMFTLVALITMSPNYEGYVYEY